MKILVSLLLAVSLLVPVSATASEDPNLRGLRFWNNIDREVVETSSGLKYKVLIMGNGRKPKPSKKVRVHYRGLLLNGVVFDSSFADDEPVKLSLRTVIEGWKEGIPLMPEGSVFVFMIPPELAYRDKQNGLIPPNSTLIFEVELFGRK